MDIFFWNHLLKQNQQVITKKYSITQTFLAERKLFGFEFFYSRIKLNI
jgi:hypothetical protein